MKKKLKEGKSVSETTGTVNIPLVITKTSISKLENDYGRGDLNEMRDKINEIIDNGNKSL